MLKEILKVMLIVLILLGIATKLETPRNIAVSGAISGNANFDGSENINIVTMQSNIAVLTGSIVMPEQNSETLTGQTTINYPKGYNKDNCIIISLLGQNKDKTDRWSTTMKSDAVSIALGNGDLCTSLTTTNIIIRANKVMSSQPRHDINFKVVLMKIS